MGRRLEPQSGEDVLVRHPGRGNAWTFGDTTPTNGQSGFVKGCLYSNLSGSAGSLLYINTGSATSTTWTNLA